VVIILATIGGTALSVWDGTCN